jgi:stage III sporulation protein AF
MGIIRELVQTIVVIVVLAVFIEMLLPRGDMRRYVKMVMGLLVILAVLQTAANAVHSELMRDVPGITMSDAGVPPLDEIMAAGKQLSELNRDEAAQKYREGIAGQVLALAGLNSKVHAVDAVVSTGGEMNEIREITSIFSTTGDQHLDGAGETETPVDVEPVMIDVRGNETTRDAGNAAMPGPEEKRAALEVTRAVAEFYNLQPGQVKYEFRESSGR